MKASRGRGVRIELLNDSPNVLLIHRFNHAPFGDDAADEAGRGDVEGRVVDADARRGRLTAEAVGDFGRGSLLDRDLIAGGECQVERGGWRRDIKRNAVSVGEDGDAVGAD